MILQILDFLSAIALPVSFACHIMIFLGGFYVAMHSRILPTWITTCLWYTGLSSLFICITILIEWVAGFEHDMAYNQIGVIGEMFLFLSLAVIVTHLFVHTIYTDYKNRSKRNSQENVNKFEI